MNKLLMLSILVLAFDRGIRVKSGFLMNFSSLIIVAEIIIEYYVNIDKEKLKLTFTAMELIIAVCLLVYAFLSFLKIGASIIF